MSVNKVFLLGNLGKDPETITTPSGTTVCKFSLATTEKYKDSNGDQKETTTWHNVVAFKKLAETCGKYLVKGSSIFMEGKIQTRSYDGKDGEKKYVTEVVLEQMQMLGGKSENETRKADPQPEDLENDPIPF